MSRPVAERVPVFVTGAAGFVGTAVRRLLPDAVGLTRRPLPGLHRVADYAAVSPPEGAVLVHLAETRLVGAVDAAAAEATVETCRALLAKPWGQVVYASSAVVYGDAVARPRRPDEAVSAAGPYAAAKLACEGLVRAAGGTVLRLANTYGPGMGDGSVLAAILAQLGRSGPVSLRDLAPVRDFVHVDDVARAVGAAVEKGAVGAAVEKGAAGAGVFNVGSGVGISVGALARLVLDLAGEAGRPVIETAPAGRSSTLILDVTDTRDRLGWEPRVDLASGLGTVLEGHP